MSFPHSAHAFGGDVVDRLAVNPASRQIYEIRWGDTPSRAAMSFTRSPRRRAATTRAVFSGSR